MLRRQSAFPSSSSSLNSLLSRKFTSSFPNIASDLLDSDLSNKNQDVHDGNSRRTTARSGNSFNIIPDKFEHDHPLKQKQQEYSSTSSSHKPVNIAFQDDHHPSASSPTTTASSFDPDEEHSQFGEVLHERMRELKSEKHRDFKVTTHIATRLSKDDDNKNQDHHYSTTTSQEDSDENFFSFFDDVESELQSGASSALNQLAAASSSFHNKNTLHHVDKNSAIIDDINNLEDGQNVLNSSSSSTSSAFSSGVMLSRAIARASFCSRRAALELVASGKVKVDGVVERDPFQRIQAHNDIMIEGHRGRLRFCAPRLWAFHKPSFVTVSKTSPNDSTNAQFSMWSRYSQLVGVDHLMPVGSMPTRCHGLLMLTNDGELARWLEHSSTRVQSTWIFRVRPAIDPVLAMKLNTKGVNIGGVMRREFQFINFTGGRSRHAIRIKVQAPEQHQQQNDNISNHKNTNEDILTGNTTSSSQHYDLMPVTQMLEAIDRRVLRGGRVGFGPFTLAGLPPGGIREVTVPPFYMKYVNPIWSPFIERDWPYFRRQRVQKLLRLSRWRGLNDREQEEVEQFSCDELKRAFEETSKNNASVAEIEAEAAQFAESVYHSEPQVEVDFEEAKKKTVNNSKIINNWKW